MSKNLDFSQFKGVVSATELTPKEKLMSGISDLDVLFAGGLPVGSICEFGVPLGKEGRQVLLPFLRWGCVQWGCKILWINCHEEHDVFPPAFFAAGISPAQFYVVNVDKPTIKIKPVFLKDIFKIIVIDSPSLLKDEDCAFLSRFASKNKQVIFLLRPYFLSNKCGNIWSQYRVNIHKNYFTKYYHVQFLKGLTQKSFRVPIHQIDMKRE